MANATSFTTEPAVDNFSCPNGPGCPTIIKWCRLEVRTCEELRRPVIRSNDVLEQLQHSAPPHQTGQTPPERPPHPLAVTMQRWMEQRVDQLQHKTLDYCGGHSKRSIRTCLDHFYKELYNAVDFLYDALVVYRGQHSPRLWQGVATWAMSTRVPLGPDIGKLIASYCCHPYAYVVSDAYVVSLPLRLESSMHNVSCVCPCGQKDSVRFYQFPSRLFIFQHTTRPSAPAAGAAAVVSTDETGNEMSTDMIRTCRRCLWDRMLLASNDERLQKTNEMFLPECRLYDVHPVADMDTCFTVHSYRCDHCHELWGHYRYPSSRTLLPADVLHSVQEAFFDQPMQRILSAYEQLRPPVVMSRVKGLATVAFEESCACGALTTAMAATCRIHHVVKSDDCGVGLVMCDTCRLERFGWSTSQDLERHPNLAGTCHSCVRSEVFHRPLPRLPTDDREWDLLDRTTRTAATTALRCTTLPTRPVTTTNASTTDMHKVQKTRPGRHPSLIGMPEVCTACALGLWPVDQWLYEWRTIGQAAHMSSRHPGIRAIEYYHPPLQPMD